MHNHERENCESILPTPRRRGGLDLDLLLLSAQNLLRPPRLAEGPCRKSPGFRFSFGYLYHIPPTTYRRPEDIKNREVLDGQATSIISYTRSTTNLIHSRGRVFWTTRRAKYVKYDRLGHSWSVFTAFYIWGRDKSLYHSQCKGFLLFLLFEKKRK